MSFLDRFRRTPQTEKRAFEPPDYFNVGERLGLISGGNQPNPTLLLGAVDGWQAISAKAISDRLSSLTLQVVEERKVRAGTNVEEVLDQHPLNDTLRSNPVFSLRQLLMLVSYWLTQNGEAYLLKVTDRMRLTRELWPLSPDRMEILSDPATVIGGYIFHADGGDRTYDRSEIVRIWRPNPASQFEAMGNLGPQALAYDSSKFADETVRSHYQRDAIPRVALKAVNDAIPPDKPSLTRFLADWRTRYDRRGGTMIGLPAFLPPGFEPVEFAGFNGTGAQNVEILNHYRDRILMANGVPRSVIGDVVDANRAAAETNQFVFDQHTIKPQADLVAEALTDQVAADFGPNLMLRFEEFVSGDKTHTLAQEAQDLALKVRTVNDVREDRGLDPVDYGEDPIGTFGDKPYRPDEDTELELDDPFAFGAEPDNDEDENEEDTEPRARFFDTVGAWKQFVLRERRYQGPFQRAIRQVFRDQRDALLERLADLDFPRMARDPIDDLFGTPDEWVRLFQIRVEPVRRQAYRETAQDTLAGLGFTGEFRFEERVERDLREQAASLVRLTVETTRKDLRQAVTEGFQAGEGQNDIAKRINSVFNTRRSHARTIARTEVLKATQKAQEEGFRQSGVVARKKWNTSQDDAVRDTHRTVDGQIVGMDEPFILGSGARADTPGNGHGGIPFPPSEAINCRCFVTPVFEGEEN